MRDTTLFEDAVDVPMWLEADRALPYADRLQRDRRVSAALDARGDTVARVRAWWRTVARAEDRKLGQRLASGRAWVTFVLILVATLFGAAVAGTAFHYDGTEPVNVVRVLGVLVVPQIILLFFTLLFATGLLPGIGRLQIGAVAAAVYGRLADLPAGPVSDLFDWRRPHTTTARFARWQVLTWSQVAAVVFNIAALGTALALITFTDLAFGWSTTLDVDAPDTRTIVQTLALPWRTWLPAAVPDAALIEASRFFRLGAGASAAAPATLTGWWPFVLCGIVVYGLLPRLVLLVIALQRQHAATRALLLDDARVTALIDRMATPTVALEATGKEDAAPADTIPAPRAAAPRAGQTGRAIVWAGSASPEAAVELVRRRLGITTDAAVEAGGGRSLDEDRTAIASIDSGRGTVVVLVRAFEPPLLELLDFLRALRDRLGPATSIIVLPVPASSDRVEALHRDTWTATVARLHDPATYVETGT